MPPEAYVLWPLFFINEQLPLPQSPLTPVNWGQLLLQHHAKQRQKVCQEEVKVPRESNQDPPAVGPKMHVKVSLKKIQSLTYI